MRMRRIHFLLLALLLSALNNSIADVNRIFLLDTSGTMRSGGLFDKIKVTIQNEYLSKIKTNEHVILLTFDEKVALQIDQMITDPSSDIPKLINKINTLRPTGQFTWISEALNLTIRQAERLQKEYPGIPINIYFITDGKNEPPPFANESPLEFVELILEYFGEFKVDNTSVYLMVYPSDNTPQAITNRKEELEKETGITIFPVDPNMNTPMPPEVILEPGYLDLGEVNGQLENQKSATISVLRFLGDVSGKSTTLHVKDENNNPVLSFNCSPKQIEFIKEGQRLNLTFNITSNLPLGHHRFFLHFESNENLIITPKTMEVQINVSVPTPPINTPTANPTFTPKATATFTHHPVVLTLSIPSEGLDLFLEENQIKSSPFQLSTDDPNITSINSLTFVSHLFGATDNPLTTGHLCIKNRNQLPAEGLFIYGAIPDKIWPVTGVVSFRAEANSLIKEVSPMTFLVTVVQDPFPFEIILPLLIIALLLMLVYRIRYAIPDKVFVRLTLDPQEKFSQEKYPPMMFVLDKNEEFTFGEKFNNQAWFPDIKCKPKKMLYKRNPLSGYIHIFVNPLSGNSQNNDSGLDFLNESTSDKVLNVKRNGETKGSIPLNTEKYGDLIVKIELSYTPFTKSTANENTKTA